MYIHIHQDKKCKKCGAVNMYENVRTDSKESIRCTTCGHEAIIWELSISEDEFGGQSTSIYTMPAEFVEEF